MTLKERQWQLREDAILDAAYEIIAQRGTADVGMDDVAGRAGVSKPTLYQHFAGKDELIVSVSMRLMAQSEAALAAREPGTPALRHLARTLQESVARRAGLWSARVAIPREMAEANAQYRAQRTRVQAELARLVDEAKAEGDVDPRFPTPVVVRMLSRLFRGDYEDLLADGTVSPEELGSVLIGIAFGGLRPRLEAEDGWLDMDDAQRGLPAAPQRARTA
ncbi:MAG TPA: TetR/AcrR family transcriptional regulator [Longimicrobiaceae bacterium]|jgi:AcrR family transcriptional regulator|nr:TetR/AcrR family transcriptional regulator [Longimicrobiaceae bacterium]